MVTVMRTKRASGAPPSFARRRATGGFGRARSPAGFPLRSRLPADVVIEPVPVLFPVGRQAAILGMVTGGRLSTVIGTTWYERGAAYWIRRAAATFGLWICLAGLALVAVLVYWATICTWLHLSVHAAVALQIAMSLGGGSLAFAAERSMRRRNVPPRPGRWPTRRGPARYTPVAPQILLFVFVSLAVLPLWIVSLSWPAAGFMMSLMPVPYPEQGARHRLAAALRERSACRAFVVDQQGQVLPPRGGAGHGRRR